MKSMNLSSLVTAVLWSATAALACGISAEPAVAEVIDFSGLSGTNGATFGTYSEDGFAVSSQYGNWYESQIFGTPEPSIYAGPVSALVDSAVRVTRTDGGTFTFSSVDLSSNNGPSSYAISGYFGLSPVFSQSGSFGGFPGPWVTIAIGGFGPIDILNIEILRVTGSAATSVNVDNIRLNPVPEPGTLGLLGLSLAGLGLSRRRKAR